MKEKGRNEVDVVFLFQCRVGWLNSAAETSGDEMRRPEELELKFLITAIS